MARYAVAFSLKVRFVEVPIDESPVAAITAGVVVVEIGSKVC